MIARKPAAGRSGTALTELALVMTFILMPIMDGVLQVGRLIQVQQLVSNAAREGCRVAAQGVTIQENGSTSLITSGETDGTIPTSPSVRGAAYQSLAGSGLKKLRWADVGCVFRFTTGSTETHQPHAGVKNQQFSVRVSVPWNQVRWPSLWNGVQAFVGDNSISAAGAPAATVNYTAEWRILVDDTFSVNTSVPGASPIR